MSLVLLLLPTLASACSSVCVTKCLLSFQSPGCSALCGCPPLTTPIAQEQLRAAALCGDRCAADRDYQQYVDCCGRETQAVGLVGRNTDPWPFMVDPETQAVEYCNDSCRSFCAVLFTRPQLDCYPLCSALFCVNPSPPAVAMLGVASADSDQRLYLWAWVGFASLCSLALLASLFSAPAHCSPAKYPAVRSTSRGDIPYPALQQTVKASLGVHAITAIRDAQTQCFDAVDGYQSGNALWYYISIVYFEQWGGRGLLEGDSDALVHSELLSDLGKAYLRDRIKALMQEYPKSLRVRSPAATDESMIVSMVKPEALRNASSEYLSYYLRKQRPQPTHCCLVCGSSDSDSPLNPIQSCSVCRSEAHARCYGAALLRQWICDQCKVFGPQIESRLQCAICGRAGGVLKSTVQTRDWRGGKDRSLPPCKRKLWVHLYCAAVSGASFLLPESKEMIDLSAVPSDAWGRRCVFCKDRTGAVAKCAVKRCEESFHADCWRREVRPPAPWERFELGCRVHSGGLSQERVLHWEASVVKEVITFGTLLFNAATLKSKSALRKRPADAHSRLTSVETKAFLRMLTKLLAIATAHQPVTITLNRRLRTTDIRAPVVYNLASPAAVRESQIAIPGRCAQECCDHYVRIYDKIREKLQQPIVELTALTGEMMKAISWSLRGGS